MKCFNIIADCSDWVQKYLGVRENFNFAGGIIPHCYARVGGAKVNANYRLSFSECSHFQCVFCCFKIAEGKYM